MRDRTVRFGGSTTLVLGLVSCGPTVDGTTAVEAQERGGVWVFTYAEPPVSWMDALGSGPASVADDCLRMGDAVVVWWEDHLDAVDEAIARVQDGEALRLQVSGGGFSLDEGSTVDDFPPEVVERCAATEIWYAGDGALEIEVDPTDG